jgi:hypothetical protein
MASGLGTRPLRRVCRRLVTRVQAESSTGAPCHRNSEGMDTALVVATLAGAFSLLGIALTAVVGFRTQRQIATLTERRDEASARRDYLYVARKRLYSEVNPQLFRMREHCEPTIWRVRRIVSGEISVDDRDQVRKATWRLVGPLVIAQEIQGRLTAVDLGVDPAVRAQYVVSRQILRVLHEGKVLAGYAPVLPYPEKPRQHLTWAQLQRLVDACTVDVPGQPSRPIRLNELEDRAADPELTAVLDRVEVLLEGATPASRPVLWRVLLAYASLMSVLIDLVDQEPHQAPRPSAKPRHVNDHERSIDVGPLDRVLPANIDKYAWPSSDGPSFESQLCAVETYVRDRLAATGLAPSISSVPASAVTVVSPQGSPALEGRRRRHSPDPDMSGRSAEPSPTSSQTHRRGSRH